MTSRAWRSRPAKRGRHPGRGRHVLARPRIRMAATRIERLRPGRGSAMQERSRVTTDELARIDAYWRAANYLSVGQIYLLDNPLLREKLQLAHIKPRLL